MSQYNSLVALSLLLLSLIIACNGFYQSSYKLSCNKFSRSSSPLMMAGFGKPKENAEKKDNAPSLDSPCPCGSGKQYQNCCQPYHDTALDAVSPVDIIRGRFSSLCAGKGSYLIKTCHPGNKEFVPDDNTLKVGSKKTKRMIWEKEV